MTIRKYPYHGKFEGQPLIAEYVYELSMNGGPDEELSFDGDPWVGLLKVRPHEAPHSLLHAVEAVAREHGDTLTGAERELLDNLSGVILEETNQGFVNVGFYSRRQKKELDKEWKGLEKEYERWSEKGEW